MANQRGGFDCEFVEKPPDVVQSECPVCLLVLREPYQATCCGHGFCRVCTEHLRADNKPCSYCNAKDFDCFEDKRLKQLLNKYKIHCSNKKQGCQWVGELGGLENHLNSNPSQDKQLEHCQFIEVQCLHCSKPLKRSNVEVHQNDQCLKRPFSCEYCKGHKSTFEDVTINHWPVCRSYPIKCPNKCSDDTIERQNLDSHVTNDCPLTVIDCDFKHVGCETRVPRKYLPIHLTDNLVPHVSLQTKQLMDLEKKNKQLEQQVEKLTDDLKTQTLCMDTTQSVISKLQQQVEKLMEDLKTDNLRIDTFPSVISELQQEVQKLTRDLNTYQIGTPLCPVKFTMTDFEQHKNDNDHWYSVPFYTRPKGYKMCLRVFAGGVDSNTNTNISLFLKLMKGEYDEQLVWPFRGKFNIELLSQNGEEIHSVTVDFDDAPTTSCSRVVDGRLAEGWGYGNFIPHTELKPKYLQNGCLKFCVKKVY